MFSFFNKHLSEPEVRTRMAQANRVLKDDTIGRPKQLAKWVLTLATELLQTRTELNELRKKIEDEEYRAKNGNGAPFSEEFMRSFFESGASGKDGNHSTKYK